MKKKALLIILICLLVAGCSKKDDGKESSSGKKTYSHNFIGKIPTEEVSIIMGERSANLTALIAVKFSQNIPEYSFGELYVHDAYNGKHVILKSSVISEGVILWEIGSDTALGKGWQNRSYRGYKHEPHTIAQGAPSYLMYLRTQGGIYEIDASKTQVFVPEPGDSEMFSAIEVTALGDTIKIIKNLFVKDGISLPSGEKAAAN